MMQKANWSWAGLALLTAACGPMGGDGAREDDEDREERSVDDARGGAADASEADAAEADKGEGMVEAPAEAPLAGEWTMDGTVIGRVDAGVYEITDYSLMIYEDGVMDFSGRIEASDGAESASFGLEGLGSWTRTGDRVRMDLSQITVTPEQSGSDYREAARLLEAAIRSQPSQSGDIVELDERTLRLRNVATGTVENYTR